MARITVSMPYWKTPDTIARAVSSILAQTHKDLILVVVNDGDHETPPWPELAHINDPRLIRFDLPENRGRYFADAVVLAATQTPYFAICDADDWAENEWLAGSLDMAQRYDLDAVYPALMVHRDAHSAGRLERVGSLDRQTLGPHLRHVAHHVALYRTRTLRGIGGPHPGFRVGYDTLMSSLMVLTGRARATHRPLYHRLLRPGSLTRAPATGYASPYRQQAARRLQQLYTACLAEGCAGPAIGDVSPQLRAQVDAEAARLRTLMPPAPSPKPDLTRTSWAIDEHTTRELEHFLHTRRPRLIVEAGSGHSTVTLAEYASRTGATVISLEHLPEYAAQTTALLASRGLAAHVDLRLAPLAGVGTPDGPRAWYATPLPDGVDFALIDGPPKTVGRHAAMYALHPHLAEGWEVWLDDAHRPGERDCLTRWAKHLGVSVHVTDTPKGLAKIRAAAPRPEAADKGV